MTTRINFGLPASMIAALALAACSPTIKVEAPDKPIVINLNIKIEQEVRIRIDKDVDQAIQSKPGIF
jgi:lipoprotein NlpI